VWRIKVSQKITRRIVFCSDGLSHVKVEVAALPVLHSLCAVMEECKSMNPSAFEVFQHEILNESVGGSGLHSQEYPMHCLAVLKKEAEKLQVELQATSNPQSDDDKATYELQKVALKLAQQLTVPQQHSESGELQLHSSQTL